MKAAKLFIVCMVYLELFVVIYAKEVKTTMSIDITRTPIFWIAIIVLHLAINNIDEVTNFLYGILTSPANRGYLFFFSGK